MALNTLTRYADAVSRTMATGFGLGYLPGPTGTYGSMLGVLLFWVATRWGLDTRSMAALAVVITLFSIALASNLSRQLGREDPREVVCDEIAGQWITFLGVVLSWQSLLAGFLLFRVFDIVKPYPARNLENLPGGWGIVTDDIMAGIYAHLALRLLLYLNPGGFFP